MIEIRKVAIKALPIFFGNGFGALVSLVTTPFLINHLGVTGYGKWITIFTILQIFNAVFNLQSWQSLVKYWYDSRYSDQKNLLITSCIKLDLVSAFLAVVLLVFSMKYICSLLDVNIEQYELLIIISALYVFLSQTSFAMGILRCFDKFGKIAIFATLTALLRIVCISIAVVFNFNFIETLLLNLLPTMLVNILQFSYSLFLVYKRGYTVTCSGEMPIGFTKYAFWVNLKIVADLPITHLDKIIITFFLGLSSVAYYDLIKKIASVIGMIASPFGQVFLPFFSKLVGEGKSKEALKASLLYGVKGFAFLMFVLLILRFSISYCNFDYCKLIPFELLDSGFIYISAQAMASSFVLLHVLFMAMGKVKQDFFFLLISNIIYFATILILIDKIKLYSIGIALFIQVLMVVVYKVVVIRRDILQ